MTKENKLTVIDERELLGKDFKVYGTFEEPLFLAKDVAEWIEYGVSNVSKMVKNIDEDEKIITRTNNTSATFLTEDGLYEVLMLSRKPTAKQFKKEVKKILKQLRLTGVVISENATDEAIDFEKKFGKYRIRKTFTNSNDLRADYEQFKELATKEWKSKRLNGKDRIKLQEIIFDAIQNRLTDNLTDMRGSEMLAMQELLTEIKNDTLKLSNNTNGGYKSAMTKKIDKLEKKIDELTPVALSDMYCCNYHPFSWNYALKNGMRTDSYNRWLYYFPYEDFPSKEDMEAEGIDFSKPIRVILRCVHLEKFDTTNLSKSFIDAMFNNYRGVWHVDDCIVRGENLETVGFCDSYKDGKMYWYLENFNLDGEE